MPKITRRKKREAAKKQSSAAAQAQRPLSSEQQQQAWRQQQAREYMELLSVVQTQEAEIQELRELGTIADEIITRQEMSMKNAMHAGKALIKKVNALLEEQTELRRQLKRQYDLICSLYKDVMAIPGYNRHISTQNKVVYIHGITNSHMEQRYHKLMSRKF